LEKAVSHVQVHLSYLAPNNKLELDTDWGDGLRGKEAIEDLFKQWPESINN